MKVIEVKVRPIPTNSSDKGGDKSLKGASRIYVNKEVLYELTGTALENGKHCVVEKQLDQDGQIVRREASLWVAADPKLSRAVAQMSKAFQDACDFKLGDQVKILYTEGKTIPDAEEVALEDVTGADQPAIQSDDKTFWERSIHGHLMGVDDVFAGLTLKRIFADQVYRSFKVLSVNGSQSANAHFAARTTKVVLTTASDLTTSAAPRPTRIKLDSPIQGLEPQIHELNQLLRTWSRPFRSPVEPKSCGLVLHGGHGTGKTLLLNQVCQTGWGTVHRIQPNDKLSAILDTFQRARDGQPSIVVMDRFEQLIDKDRSNRNAVIAAVGEFLDKLVAEADAKGEKPKVVVLAACLDYLTDIPHDLTDLDRFVDHVHLPLPDMARRRAILSSLGLPLPPDSKEEILTRLSERTHAYNGTDLVKLAREASKIHAARLDDLEDTGAVITAEDEYLSEQILEHATQTIRPSAMHDINLKPPPVHWDDIGGQDEVKKSLQEAIALATVPKERLLRYTPNPPKGFLLYGPPGCSKTMAAQALATEADLNFFAVKGAELLNMYVGESERQIRQLFQRARDAAPSIIFFDEIDSIGGQRSGFGGGGASASSGGSGLNVLTTLLNEMQGFEQTQGVLVLAATNRPQALDPALLRPGRFDKLIYVRPPDEAARAAIFRKFAATRQISGTIDVDALAKETEGFSGAEIARICSDAGLVAWRRVAEGSAHEEEGIMMDDLRREIGQAPRMITREMLEAYEAWAKRFLKGAAEGNAPKPGLFGQLPLR